MRRTLETIGCCCLPAQFSVPKGPSSAHSAIATQGMRLVTYTAPMEPNEHSHTVMQLLSG